MATIKKKGMAAFIALSTAIGAPATMLNEGVSLTPYFDRIGNKVTWCAGETEIGYKPKFTYSECGALFKIRYGYYSYKVAMMYNDTAQAIVTPEMHAAATDLAYNVGIEAVRKSSLMRHFNAGAAREGCKAILLYKYAGGVDCSLEASKRVCGGIWTRRLQFTDLCLGGVQ